MSTKQRPVTRPSPWIIGPADTYESLWRREIRPCVKCRFDERIDSEIREHWLKPETPFLPYPGVGPEPPNFPVRYLLVGEEPNLRPKGAKRTRADYLKKIAEGSRNFRGDTHIRFAAHRWLIAKGEAFVMTDLAKCIVPMKKADETRSARYANCSHWLDREVRLFPTLRAIVPMSHKARKWLRALRQPSWPPITRPIIHPAWTWGKRTDAKAGTRGLPSREEFDAFARECDPKDPMKLTQQRLDLLARWQVQFAEIRAGLQRLGA